VETWQKAAVVAVTAWAAANMQQLSTTKATFNWQQKSNNILLEKFDPKSDGADRDWVSIYD